MPGTRVTSRIGVISVTGLLFGCPHRHRGARRTRGLGRTLLFRGGGAVVDMYLGAHVARLADLIDMLTLNRTSGAESRLLGELEANPYPKTRRRRATWSWQEGRGLLR
jgi:hypothetical protein